jgi:hypothetical protein
MLNLYSLLSIYSDFVPLMALRGGFPEHKQIFEIAVGETDATDAT